MTGSNDAYRHTAVLLFSRTAGEEARHKTLIANSFDANKKLIQRLNQHAKRESLRSGLSFLHADGLRQKGSDFGERLSNSLEWAFAQGYESVIAIGNDCIELNAKDLQKIARQLRHSELVLGPSLDGGVYALGIHRSAYKREEFLNLAWESSELLVDLQNYGANLSSLVYELEAKQDLDQGRDLTLVLQSYGLSSYLKALLELKVFYPLSKLHFSFTLSASESLLNNSRRGPPILLS
jgi:glycosyltransferase A (GT-A) superfamily protein (DUF2064 family)